MPSLRQKHALLLCFYRVIETWFLTNQCMYFLGVFSKYIYVIYTYNCSYSIINPPINECPRCLFQIWKKQGGTYLMGYSFEGGRFFQNLHQIWSFSVSRRITFSLKQHSLCIQPLLIAWHNMHLRGEAFTFWAKKFHTDNIHPLHWRFAYYLAAALKMAKSIFIYYETKFFIKPPLQLQLMRLKKIYTYATSHYSILVTLLTQRSNYRRPNICCMLVVPSIHVQLISKFSCRNAHTHRNKTEQCFLL